MAEPVTPPGASSPPTYEIGAVYRAHAQTVARWAARLGGPGLGADGIEDVVQEVFLTAHRLLPTFRGEAKITTWLFRITQNQIRHRRRKERFRRFLAGSAEDIGARLPARGPSPVEELERQQASTTVYKVLDGMSEKYRTAFILFEIEHLSGEEIAALLQQKIATIWVWLHRARAQFVAGLERSDKREQARGRPGRPASSISQREKK
jgi:RNA polymerase sigma-70 factor, ECF subfamily